MKQIFFILTVTAVVLFSCGSGSKTPKNKDEKQPADAISNELPGYIVYKTKADYSRLVPVVLARDRSAVESFPAPAELLVDGQFSYPIKLAQGYFLGRHRIGPRTAFLKWDYEKFFQDGATLSTDDLNDLILDTDPFTEMYNCITRIEESVAIEYFNDLIKNGRLADECTQIK